MAENVKLPVIGDVPRTVMYVGGAALAGIVGYAWWTRGGETTVTEPEVPVDEFGDERITPTTVDTFDVAVDTRTGITTNAEWSQFVISHLAGLGYDSTVVSTAVGRFLARQPLGPVDLDIARQAWAVGGEPPEGRPWTIIPAPAQPAPVVKPAKLSGPARVTAVSAGKRRARVTWTPVVGASGYQIRQEDGLDGGQPHPWHKVGLSTTWSGSVEMHRPRDLTVAFRVQTLGAGGALGGNRVSGSVSIKY